MSSSALLKLHAFHRQLNAHALEAARHFTALNTDEIAAYSQSFHQSVPSEFLAIDEAHILQTIPEARFLLFGDFHTLKQSQRGFLQLLAETRRSYPLRPLTVALEIFNASDQTHIDDLQAGRITEEVFLRKIDYHNKWGFPWENYQPIVAFCSEFQINIIGINGQFNSAKRLARRDVYAAGILNRWADSEAEAFCFCLIGEYHLGDRHLMSQLKPEYRSLRVIANVDEFALQTLHAPVAGTQYLQLASDFYCVLNTVPWVKWQSLAVWEELHATGDQIPHPDDLYTEHHYDFDYQLLHILKELNGFLELGLSKSDLTHFDLYFRPDRATLGYLKTKLDLDQDELAAAGQGLASEGFYYFSPARAIVVQDFSISHFAEAAGHILFDILQGNVQAEEPEAMARRIQRHVCSTLASLLMNPRQTRESLPASSVPSKGLSQIPKLDRHVELLQILLSKARDLSFLDAPQLCEDDRQRGYGLSKRLGEALGSLLFQSLWQLSGEELVPCLQHLFRCTLSQQLDQLARLNYELQSSRSAS